MNISRLEIHCFCFGLSNQSINLLQVPLSDRGNKGKEPRPALLGEGDKRAVDRADFGDLPNPGVSWPSA